MAKYIPYDYNQNLMVVINFQDQLQPGTFEHALHYLVTQRLDLSIFNEAYKNDEQGRPAYDPAILLKIILFAYAQGITSNRAIQWCCETNILFKALSFDSVPHFTTIASFVSGYPSQIESLFEQVLLICHEQGLLGNELFAIDGCKLSSNAAKAWSETHQELRDKRDKLKRLIRHHYEDQHGNLKAFFEGRLSQCRQCELKTQCMINPASANHRKGNGRQVSFILNKKRELNSTDWMKHRVDSPKGKEMYSHRMPVVEPVFGNLTVNKGLKRFSLRGKIKVNAQWKLFCLVQNIEKLANFGKMVA